jgi:hypothetical protein
MKIYVNLWKYFARFFLEWEIFQIKVVEKIKTHILCTTPFLEYRVLYELMWKNIVEPGRSRDNLAQAYFMLGS